MTSRQAEVFEFIKEYINEHNYSPTYREIGEAIGVSSLSTVHKHIHCLKAEGKITLDENTQQSIKIVKETVSPARFWFEGKDHLWDNKLKCYWVKEKEVVSAR